ncbi:hypothetical protein [Streptomyces sp. NPDC096324]|uniref:hypothetical protein n=1 Tax=Streptomyces sp. NPDC096324 TaxID=3366085 RepID=UPI003808C60B
MALFIVIVLLGILGFGFVAVRASRESETASPSPAADTPTSRARDIPPLFPDFFHGVLFAVGKDARPQNLLALAEYVSQMISANAYGWFHQRGDSDAAARFSRRFRGGGPADQHVEKVPDDMIDFLWSWDAGTHGELRDWIPRLERDLTAPGSQLWRYADELPFGMWESDD